MNAIIITGDVSAKLREMIDFAEKNGCLHELGRSLCHLIMVLTSNMVDYKDGEPVDVPERNVVAEIRPDFAPYSLSWVIWRNRKFESPRGGGASLVGGFIYHGPTSPGDGSAPALSVHLDSFAGRAPQHSWGIHT